MVTDNCVHNPSCECICNATCCLNSPLTRCLLDKPRTTRPEERGHYITTRKRYTHLVDARRQGLKIVEVAAAYNVSVRTVVRACEEARVNAP